MSEAVLRRFLQTRPGSAGRAFACWSVAAVVSLSGVAQTTATAPQAAAAPQVVTVQVPTTQTSGQPTTGADWSQAAQASARSTTNGPLASSSNATPAMTAAIAEQEPPQTEFQRLVYRTLGTEVPIFGSDLFRNAPSTFAPMTGQVTGDYVIGPGDELRLSASGQLNQQGSFVVDRAGTITIPEVGTVTVAGLRFDELKPFLTRQLGRVYRNFQLNVTLGQTRAIQVYVTGEARRPGSYTVSSLSTLLNAIFASGGVLPQGSLRAIRLERGGRTVTTLDLYDLILRGDKTHDATLQPGDVIFIPKAGPQVAAVGSITNPAIYELRGETTVDQLLQLANGPTSTAQTTDARIESIFNNKQRTVAEINLKQDGGRVLQDGDILTVTSITGEFRDAVTLRGNVSFPGRYTYRPGMRITDVIPNRNALLTRAYFGAHGTLTQIRNGVPMSPSANDSATADAPKQTLSTQGASSNTATGQTANTNGSGTSVSEALTENNGAFPVTNQVVLSSPDVDLAYAVVERLDRTTLTTSLLPFNLGRALDGDASQNLLLQPGDVITVFSKADIRVPQSQQTRFVRLEGEFVGAGIYSVLPGETLRQLVARSGGLTPEAYLYASQFTRESTRRVEQQRLREYADSLEAQINLQIGNQVSNGNLGGLSTDAISQAANAGSTGGRTLVARLRAVQPTGRIILNLKPDSVGLEAVPDIALEDGDRFVVSRQPSTVTVTGEVFNASAFLYEPGKEVRDFLRSAGGPQRDADSKRIFVVRADGTVVSKQYNHVERATIFPGDTVVVPPQLTRGNFLRNALIITSLVGTIATPLTLIGILAR